MARNRKTNIGKSGNSKFRRAWNYIGESRNYIYFVSILFLLGAVFGFIFKESLVGLDPMLKELVDKIKDLNLLGLIWYIFQNNILSAFFALVFGVFFGLLPLFNAGFNGVVLGYVFSRAAEVGGIGVVWKILPHGIFELPAVMIAVGLGLKLGLGFFVNFFEYNKENRFRIFVGLLSIFAGIFGLIFIFSGFSFIFGVGNADGSVLSGLIGLIFGLVVLYPLFYLMFYDSKLRKLQRESFSERIFNSFLVFVYVVLPLLIIAAIIEGSLIYFMK